MGEGVYKQRSDKFFLTLIILGFVFSLLTKIFNLVECCTIREYTSDAKVLLNVLKSIRVIGIR